MPAALVVLQKTGIMFLVMLAGWLARRRGWLGPEVATGLSRFVVELAFPALVFTQMLRTVTAGALRTGWWVPLLAVFLLIGGAWVGRLGARLARVEPASRRTFVFLVAIPNWVFLPLLIADGLYGAEGVAFVLLLNVGAQIVLWTEGVRMLHGRPVGRDALRGLLGNAGLMATFAGIAVALAWPGSAALGEKTANASGLKTAGDTVIGALRMLGDLTIPLSLLVSGAQLGTRVRSSDADNRALVGVIVTRLLVAPAVLLAVLGVGTRLVGWRMPEVAFMTTAVIAAMPVAVSCPMFVERFGGDGELSAGGVFYTTLLSLATVPAVVWACRAVGL